MVQSPLSIFSAQQVFCSALSMCNSVCFDERREESPHEEFIVHWNCYTMRRRTETEIWKLRGDPPENRCVPYWNAFFVYGWQQMHAAVKLRTYE